MASLFCVWLLRANKVDELSFNCCGSILNVAVRVVYHCIMVCLLGFCVLAHMGVVS